MRHAVVTHRESYALIGGGIIAALVFFIGDLHALWLICTSDWRAYAASLLYVWTAVITVSSHCNLPSYKRVPSLTVDVVVACTGNYHDRLRVVLDSLASQTVPPRTVYLIHNGDGSDEAEKVFDQWLISEDASRILNKVFWTQTDASKRDAHELAIRATDAQILLMVDSVTRLDPFAIQEGLRAFATTKVRSVGGLLLPEQPDKPSLIARLAGFSFMASYMHDKAGSSLYKSVTVNRGGLAFIRVPTARTALPSYLTQEVVGSRVDAGDDRALTLAAAFSGGHTVLQETCVGYTPHPSTFYTVSRRYARWWRTYWLSNISLLRQFPVKRAIWHLSLTQSVMFVIHGLMVPAVLVDALMNGRSMWPIVGYIVLMAYLRSIRTLAIRRPDQRFAVQAMSFILLVPLVALLELWTYVALMWYGILTVRKTEWHPPPLSVSK